ncbi:MAG: flagellar FlbD family protein [Armatimonadetes bacterium]|nr:flagellar FlbD family protein [Armatimonadota bacterium]
MVKVRRLDGSRFVLNAELIETLEATPDTVLRLTNGKVYVVKEGVDEVLASVIAYKRAMFTHLFGNPAEGPEWPPADPAAAES